jgi:hypothetical protein
MTYGEGYIPTDEQFHISQPTIEALAPVSNLANPRSLTPTFYLWDSFKHSEYDKGKMVYNA